MVTRFPPPVGRNLRGDGSAVNGHIRPTEPADVVATFLAALERLDVDAAVALLDPDVLYVNVSLPPARGRAATARLLAALGRYATGFGATCHRLAADGTTVLTERTDTITVGRFSMSFWVCGTFEVVDGRIVLWRDYFDWGATSAAAVTGLARAAASLVRGRSDQIRGGPA